MKGCRNCPNDTCIDCFDDTEINYPELSDDEALKQTMTDLNIRTTYSDKIYCDNYCMNLSNGLRIVRHYAWNIYKRKMIEIIGIYYIGYVYSYMLAYNEQNLSYSCLGEEFNNEYFQSVRQGYEFTYIDHIYQKEDKYYIYNNKTLLFDPIDGDLNCEASKPTPKKCTIGQNEKCKTCDENDPGICGLCNEGYYLPLDGNKLQCEKCSMKGCRNCPNDTCIDCFDDTEINYPGLSDDEALKQTMTDLIIRTTYSDKIYCDCNGIDLPNGLRIVRHYAWNKYKRKMVEIIGIYHIGYDYNYMLAYNEQNVLNYYAGEEFNDEYLQSVRQGYEFTYIDHIYQKNDKYYKYNNKTLLFDEIEELQCVETEINKELETDKNEKTEKPVPETEHIEKTCDVGDNEKCNSCDPINPLLCGSCNEGYYLPSTGDKTKCKQCSVPKCKVCPDDYCTQCFGENDNNDEINYPYLTEEMALKTVMDSFNVYNFKDNKIFCPIYEKPDNPKLQLATYKYYIWNRFKRVMIELEGEICESQDNKNENKNTISYPENEYIRAVNEGYEFTFLDHIYTKNNKAFEFKSTTKKFEEIGESSDYQNEYLCENKKRTFFCNIIGCKTCDPNDSKKCVECMNRFYPTYQRVEPCKPCTEKGCKKCPNDFCLKEVDDPSLDKINEDRDLNRDKF